MKQEKFNNNKETISKNPLEEKPTKANLEPVKKLIKEKVKDGDLSDSDIKTIINKTKSLYKETPLTPEDIKSLCETLSVNIETEIEKDTKVPILLRVLGIVGALSWLISIPTIISSIQHVQQIVTATQNVLTATTITLIILHIIAVCAIISLSIIAGIFMFFNKRVWAGRILYSAIACTALLLLLITMLEGVSNNFFFMLAFMIIQIVISVILQPKLYQERVFCRELKNLDTEERAKTGRLGFKIDQSKRYIELDFFNLFWIFVIGSIIGLIGEYIFHIIFVWGFDPANWYDRSGLLFGPFSPIYGFGAVFMTLFLNRFKNINPVLLFVCTTFIGGAFEYVVSWFLETAFGIKAWDYSGLFLSINGRTCLLFAAIFGVMGFVWIKWGLPIIMKLINKIPWKLRYPITFVFAAFMIVNCVMTLQAIDCWAHRTAGVTPVTQIEKFYNKNYNDEFMSKRFASMSFDSSKSSRENLDKSTTKEPQTFSQKLQELQKKAEKQSRRNYTQEEIENAIKNNKGRL